MAETGSTLDVRQRIGVMLNRVVLWRDEFVIERKGKQLARSNDRRAHAASQILPKHTRGDGQFLRRPSVEPRSSSRISRAACNSPEAATMSAVSGSDSVRPPISGVRLTYEDLVRLP